MKTSMGGCVGSHHDSSGSLNENSDGTGGRKQSISWKCESNCAVLGLRGFPVSFSARWCFETSWWGLRRFVRLDHSYQTRAWL